MTKVLFVCVANSGRSVMAERIFRRDARGRHEARSAGSAPGTAVRPSGVYERKPRPARMVVGGRSGLNW